MKLDKLFRKLSQLDALMIDYFGDVKKNTDEM